MSETMKPVLRIYYVPQTFPCGPDSSCCGPIGQSQEELQQYRAELEKALPWVAIETINADKASGGKLDLRRDMPAIRLLNSFGYAACPIVVLNDEVISMGPPVLEELVTLVREKLALPSPSGA